MYEAVTLTTTYRCESDDPDLLEHHTDSLDYFIELNDDGTGHVYGDDTLADFEWIVVNIKSTIGKTSGGCYNEFDVWTEKERINYR